VEGFTVAIRISPRSLLQILTLVILSLTVINIAVQFWRYFLADNPNSDLGFAQSFIFEGNATVPKWVASSNLLLCALLLGTIARAKLREHSRYGPHWMGLAFIFCAISLEEAVGFHELVGELVKIVVHASGFLYHAWTILGVIFTLIIALAYCKFVFHLPIRTMRLFFLAATLYIGGAVVMEIIRGPYNEAYGIRNMTAAMLKTIEEFSQMIGIVVFIYALLAYTAAQMKELHIYIDDEASKG
jgi:hypothetical protein